MPITINGSGTVTGLAVGGLPDGTVDAGTLASGAVSNTGKILQTVVGQATGRVSNTTTSWTASDVAVTITPSATSSKILILASLDINTNGSGAGVYLTLYRDSTNLGNATEGKMLCYGQQSRIMVSGSFMHYDSPSSTSALLYKIYTLSFGSGAFEFPSSTQNPGMSELIAMEIAG